MSFDLSSLSSQVLVISRFILFVNQTQVQAELRVPFAVTRLNVQANISKLWFLLF